MSAQEQAPKGSYQQRVEERLRVIRATQERVAAQNQERTQEIIKDMTKTPQGREALTKLGY